MNWTNIGTITTTKDWQFTELFTGNYIRLRHSFSVPRVDLPWGFRGLIAQAFNYPNDIELLDVRKIYPQNYHDIYCVANPWVNYPRRLAIRGQKRYSTSINWNIEIDVMGLYQENNSLAAVSSGIATTTTFAVNSNTQPSNILPANVNRKGYAIRNRGTKPVLIGFAANFTGSNAFLTLAAGAVYESEKNYIGDIFALMTAANANTDITVFEFV